MVKDSSHEMSNRNVSMVSLPRMVSGPGPLIVPSSRTPPKLKSATPTSNPAEQLAMK